MAAARTPPAPGTHSPSASTVISSVIVGSWQRTVSCAELTAAFAMAGLLETHADFRGAPCGRNLALDRSHVFGPSGEFTTLDENGRRLDGGEYVLAAPDALGFPSHARKNGNADDLLVRFEVTGDEAAFEVVVPEPCADSCSTAHAWWVAAFGTNPWSRGEDP
jgi:hypothetical protein